MTRIAPHSTLLVFGLLLAAGCNKSEARASTDKGPGASPAAVETAAPADPAAEAARIFKAKCAMCHGNQGNGDGPAASALTPKPRVFSDAAWQAKVTDEQLKKTVIEGGAAVGLSGSMPSNPELKGRDDVLAELIKVLRAFKH